MCNNLVLHWCQLDSVSAGPRWWRWGDPSLTCTDICRASCQEPGCSGTSWVWLHLPLRSCRCQRSCPQSVRGSESYEPRRWDPCGVWWSGKVERRVGLGEGVRHSCDPDNTQRKTVASSNNGCSGKKGNGKWRQMKMRAKTQECETVQLLITNAVWTQKTSSRKHAPATLYCST